MASVTKVALYITIICFFFGQLFRIQFSNIFFPIFDIAILFLAINNLLSQKISLKKLHSPIFYFVVFSLFTLKFNWLYTPFSLVSFFYWLRLTSLLSLLLFPPKIDRKIDIFFQSILWASLIFGFIQYIFWPDFTYFSTFNWDPHLYRLVGTFFDPTFTGLIFLLFLLKVYFHSPSNYLLIFPIYLGLALTYSRSTLLSFFITFAYISIIKKNIKIFLTTSLLIFFTIILLPRMPGEGTKLERDSSIKAKIENYKQGLKLFSSSPLIGVGYNNLPTIRENKNSHANSGFDSSLLTIAVTTGIIGLFFFTKIFTTGLNTTTLYWQSLILTIFIHSLFANSLLYPWILFFLIFESRYRK
ncbi:MAG: O-antigen ligase family protein [Candidatus Shapirobacteria bacterium]